MDATTHVGVDETCLRLRMRRWRQLLARGMGPLAPRRTPPSLRRLRTETTQPASKHKQEPIKMSLKGDENRRNR